MAAQLRTLFIIEKIDNSISYHTSQVLTLGWIYLILQKRVFLISMRYASGPQNKTNY